MQCPKCSYEPTLSEQQESPDKCPSCGVIYSKIKTLNENPKGEHAASSQRKSITVQASKTHLVSGASGVTIVDIKMPFWSMVFFMVKWVLASVPALIIVAVICSMVWGVSLGLFSNSSSPLMGSAPPTASSNVLSNLEPKPKQVPAVRSITAIINDKGFISRENGHTQDELAFGLTFTNNTGRLINAFDGTVVFTDVLGNEVFRTSVSVESYFPAGGEIKRGFLVRYNQFMADHVEFNKKPKESLSVDFRPNKALFQGGEIEKF